MANFVSVASFAGTVGGSITAGDAAWVKAYGTTEYAEVASGGTAFMKTGTQVYYTRSEVPPTTTQSVTASVLLKSYVTGSNVGVSARHSASRTFIGAVLSTDGAGGYMVRLVKVSGGTFSSAAIEQPVTLSVGVPTELTLEVDGVSPAVNCTVKLDGVTVITATVTENNFDTKGSVGLLYYFGSSVTSSTGLHAASFYASDTLGGDTTAPTLTSPTASATGATTASGSVTTNEANGTLYYLASANASESAATVKAGSSQAVTAAGEQPVTITGLTAATPYYPHYLHRDAAGNDSAVASGAQFTTSATNTSPSFTGPNIADISGTEAVALTPVDVSSLFFDSESGLTFSAIGSWPAGVTVSSAGVISGTPTTAGTYASLQVRATDAGSLTADSNAFAITVAAPAVAGINVTDPLKNNAGTVLASQSGVRVAVLQAADLVSVFETSGLTTNASGILATISDAAIITGQQYHVAIKLADGGVGITGPITAS